MNPSSKFPFGGSSGPPGMDMDTLRERMSMTEMSKERQERIINCMEHLEPIKKGAVPRMPREQLQQLMIDFKEEGNQIFKEKNSNIAKQFYASAVIVGNMLEQHHYVPLEKDLQSSLYSNMAACSLKLNEYRETLAQCDAALKYNGENIKAYYRKATALKGLNNHKEAMVTALEGQKKAQGLGRAVEAQEFQSLVTELQAHVSGSGGTPSSLSWAEQDAECSAMSCDTESLTFSNAGARSMFINSEWMNGSGGTGIRDILAAAAKPHGGRRAQVSVCSSDDIDSANKDPGEVDESWLEGTNAKLKKKAQPVSNGKGKGKGGKKKGVKAKQGGGVQGQLKKNTAGQGKAPSKYQGKFAYLDDMIDSSSDSAQGSDEADSEGSQEEEEEEEEEVEEEEKEEMPEEEPIVPVHDPTKFVPSSFQGARPKQKQMLAKPRSAGEPGGMGLDDFSLPSSGSRRPPSGIRSSQPSYPTATVPPPQVPVSAEPPDLPYPFDTKYDFKLACCHCFQKIGEGPQGFRHNQRLSHPCQRDILLARPREELNGIWCKVRPRPMNNFLGHYKFCQQFSESRPCKIGEVSCTFVHNQIEQHLWALDRSGELLINEFVEEQHKHLVSVVAAGTSNTRLGREPLLAEPSTMQRVPPGRMPPGAPNQAYPSHYQPPQGMPPYDNMKPNFPPRGPLLPQPRFNATPQRGFNGPRPGAFPMAGGPPCPPGVRPRGMFGDTPRHLLHDPYGVPPPRFPPNYQPPSSMATPETDVILEDPLPETHDSCIVCSLCLAPAGCVGQYEVRTIPHDCQEDILAMKLKVDKFWLKVRERKNHRKFFGKYILCRHYTSFPPRPCTVGEDSCSFAHNDEEQILWTMEKDGEFNIQEYILQKKSSKSSKFDVTVLLRKHSGTFHFLCKVCFFGQPCRLSVQRKDRAPVCSAGLHRWDGSNCLLIHQNPENKITPIGSRPFTHKGAYYLMCHNLQFCTRRNIGKCVFAHSLVERDVWITEHDTDASREEIVAASAKKASTPTTSVPSGGPIPQSSANKSTEAEASKQPESVTPKPVKCPFRIIPICGLCWKQGMKSGQDGTKDRCVGKGLGHAWKINKMFVVVPHNKEIRPLPRKIPLSCKFIICRHVREKRKCDYSLGGYCQFAHSETEIEVWTWMVKNNVKTLEDVATLSRQVHEASSQQAKITQGQSVISAKPAAFASAQPARPAITPIDLAVMSFYCHYCSIACNSQKQWDEHCSSDKHMFNVNSDREHQWNYRQPPWGVPGGSYELCPRHQEGKCRYSDKPDMYNYCKFAHSHQELDEWKERWEWRQMKREMAKKELVFSYMDGLLDDYESAESGVSVIAEEVNGVLVECSDSLKSYCQEKSTKKDWTFTVHVSTGLELQKVALLYNKDRLHFSLVGPNGDSPCQLASGDIFLVSKGPPPVYKVIVKFTGGMFGSFMQWLVFDVGTRPCLVRKLNVELGTQFVQEKVKSLREKLSFDRWTGDNREIVRLESRSGLETDLSVQVVRSYKAPSSADLVVTQQSVGVDLNRHNYPHKMHKMLALEELTRQAIIASYNLQTTIRMQNSIEEETYLFARQGELFAKVPLNGQLSEDTDAGKLILTSVSQVLLAPISSTNKKVYEVVIVSKENFDYDGRGRDYIYLSVPQRCCKELGLRHGDNISIEIQFQMNRQYFCFMHYAVDQLENTGVVFPDVSKINPTWNEKHTLRLNSQVLNDDQMKIVRHIVAERTGYTPPLIIYGPFGTGKTETLAQATMVLMKECPEARVLICTHSNSAADLYIIKHFDAFKQHGHAELKVLRVYFTERVVRTVSTLVRSYCLLAPDGSTFVMPTEEDIRTSQVVIVTLSTSLILTKLGLHGYFTHIFIDEAAQALECEAIMPLSLANDTTCIVLAGDHMQMSPKIYSSEAKKQRFHQSLLERLYRHYEAFSRHIHNSSPLNILLSINYRSKMEILRFISAIFYGGPDRLVAQSIQATCDDIVPLTFYSTQGHEVQDQDKTSYYNIAEVDEVVDRVAELFSKWPTEWGTKQASSIGVVSPYTEQVHKIRLALRRKLPELRDVVVERVMNVQGKEFRAVFISTVRTRHLGENPPVALGDVEGDGEVGDFGFLSDQKLLNTALTRAQSFVGVIGDPIALCSIGDCMSVWRVFLKHCNNMGSIHPKTVTLETVRTQVVSMMNSPFGQNLQKLATLAQEGQNDQVFRKPQQPLNAMQPSKTTPANSTEIVDEPIPTNENPFDSASAGGFFDDWSMEYAIEPDVIIQQLAREAVRSLRALQKQKQLGKSGLAGMGKLAVDVDEPLKVECIRVKEEEGHVVICYKEEATVRNLLSADDYEKEFDSDTDMTDEDDEKLIYADYTYQQLRDFLEQDGHRYYHCILHIESSQRMYARVLDQSSDIKEIKISSRQRCGRGFHGDEVVVEMMTVEEEDLGAQGEKEKAIPLGSVIGILKRAINPRYRMFVCLVEQGNTGLMVPLNRGIPKIYNLETRTRLQKSKKGHVCVYTFTKDQEIIFHHYEPVDPFNPTSKLFIVRYIKWDSKFFSPLGIVVGVLPPGTNVEDGMRILDIEHYVRKKFKEETIQEIKNLYPANYKLPESAYHHRLDYREKLTFTIDPPDSTDLDDAISIEAVGNIYQLGVHIADVSYFVKRGSCIDKEAEKRGSTYYPVGQDQIPMIPEQLSGNLCSLLPNQDRLTLSMFLKVGTQGQVLKIQAKRCVIRSQHRLTYNEVEDIIKHRKSCDDSKLQLALLLLHRIAEMWRKRRLGNASLYHQSDGVSLNTPEAHMLIEEIMITANHQAARLMAQAFPDCTPLRHQFPPNKSEIEEWKRKFAQHAQNSWVFASAFLPRGGTCQCRGDCQCIVQPDTPISPYVDIQRDVWEEMQEALSEVDVAKLQQLVVNPEIHPQLAVALLHLRGLQERSFYVCSGDCPRDERWHHSLNVFVYAHFTSPIRRYMDLVVHRMVVAALEMQPSPYSQAEMRTLCDNCSDVSSKSRSYEQATHALHFSIFLQKNPLVLYPIVEDLSERDMKLRFPTIKDIQPSRGRVSYSQLAPAHKPLYQEDAQTLYLRWQMRVYDLEPKTEDLLRDQSKNVHLNPFKFVVQVPTPIWRHMLSSIQVEDKNNLLDYTHLAMKNLRDPLYDGHFARDVTSEVKENKFTHHFCDFSINIRPSNVMQVQVASELMKGVISPRLQLLSLTPGLSVCLEHRTDPMMCFTGTTSLKASRQNYPDVATYQACWLPVMAMEAAHGAVQNNESAIIRNVQIKWQEHGISKLTGFFCLPLAFCQSRQLKFSNDGVQSHEKTNATKSTSGQFFDFMCVRYNGVAMDSEANSQGLVVDVENKHPVCWVAHCVVTKVSVDKEKGTISVNLRLHQSSMPIPQQLLQAQDFLNKATVEWIPKILPDRRMEQAIRDLSSSSALSKDIAIGRDPKPLGETMLKNLADLNNMVIPGLAPPNQGQERAINQAVQQPFTLIQGPPGTGKTITGVRLACLFATQNQRIGKTTKDGKQQIPPQVLYCGPSNKSVDVVAGYLKCLGKSCPRLVRVYSEQVERLEFPLPNEPVPPRRGASSKISDSPVQHADIALHHLIRQKDREHSALINEMDRRFKDRPQDVDHKEVSDYLKLVSRAQIDELKRAEIILVTCTGSSAPKIILSSNVSQLIIDECGMCTEPESMVPIVSASPQQVVLIGDHKQLHPIVLEEWARRVALDKSLFERYSNKAIMLTTQYRMHEAIASFPSQHFYDGKLVCGKEDQKKPSALKFWPDARNKPIAFVHTIGREETLSVTTEEGNEMSKSNMEEVAVTERVARYLVMRYHVRSKDVVILTQYRAQCATIQRQLHEKGHKDIDVCTVVASQGSEWDYVILSTVRSMPRSEIEKKPTNGWRRRNLGFISDENQINVAITRARKGLIIIGNKHLLRCDPMWAKLLDHYNGHKKIVDAREFMNIR